MRKDVSDKAEVRQYVAKIRDVLDDPRLQDVIGRAAAQVPGNAPPRDKISSLLNQDIDSLASSGGGARCWFARCWFARCWFSRRLVVATGPRRQRRPADLAWVVHAGRS